MRSIREAAQVRSTVLITGETGTEKGMIARAIHQQSPECDRPFQVIDCTTVPEGMMESELFGHVRGAFTGAIADKPGLIELANGGSVFLDEIGELPLPFKRNSCVSWRRAKCAPWAEPEFAGWTCALSLRPTGISKRECVRDFPEGFILSARSRLDSGAPAP